MILRPYYYDDHGCASYVSGAARSVNARSPTPRTCEVGAMWLVAGITLMSGVVAAVRMDETSRLSTAVPVYTR